MKKSELRQIIKEEVTKALAEEQNAVVGEQNLQEIELLNILAQGADMIINALGGMKMVSTPMGSGMIPQYLSNLAIAAGSVGLPTVAFLLSKIHGGDKSKVEKDLDIVKQNAKK